MHFQIFVDIGEALRPWDSEAVCEWWWRWCYPAPQPGTPPWPHPGWTPPGRPPRCWRSSVSPPPIPAPPPHRRISRKSRGEMNLRSDLALLIFSLFSLSALYYAEILFMYVHIHIWYEYTWLVFPSITDQIYQNIRYTGGTVLGRLVSTCRYD